MQQEQSKLLLIVFLGTSMLMLSSTFIVVFLFYFRKRQQVNKTEKIALKTQYEKELLSSQLEIQNDTMQSLAQELHDNIGQILTLVRLNLNILEEDELLIAYQNKFIYINNLVERAITDIRSLSKSLDSDFLKDFGLEQSLTNEIQRINKLGRIKAEMSVQGNTYKLDYEKEIVLFRICQEIINNALKHSAADHLEIILDYAFPWFTLMIRDDGKGFNYHLIKKEIVEKSGSGMRNISRRVHLLKGDLTIDSKVGLGTTFEIKINA